MATQNNIFASSKTTTFTSSGTWNKDPRTKSLTIIGCCSGSGGGSGRQGASGAAGGGAGGGYGIYLVFQRVPAFIFNSSVSVTIGGTATGGAAQTSNLTDGNTGSSNNITSFGSFLVPVTGAATPGGTNGSTAAFAVGNSASIFTPTTTNLTNTGALGAGTNGLQCPYTFSGTSGGGGSGANATTPQQAGNGAIRNLNIFNQNQTAPGTNFTSGAAGGISGGTINGAAGSSYSLPNDGVFVGGTGGGGGGGQATAGGLVAGTGGDGGIPGSGGGGGGGSITGTNSGAGGNGSRGELWVIEYF